MVQNSLQALTGLGRLWWRSKAYKAAPWRPTGLLFSFRDPPPFNWFIIVISLGFHAYYIWPLHGQYRIYSLRAIGFPLPFLRHLLALKQVTSRRWFPSILSPLFPVPCPGPYDPYRGLAGGYQPGPNWALLTLLTYLGRPNPNLPL